MYQFTEDDIIWLKAHGFACTNGLDEIYDYEKEHLKIKVFILNTGIYCHIRRYIVTEDFYGRGETMKEAMETALRLMREQMEHEKASFDKATTIIGELK